MFWTCRKLVFFKRVSFRWGDLKLHQNLYKICMFCKNNNKENMGNILGWSFLIVPYIFGKWWNQTISIFVWCNVKWYLKQNGRCGLLGIWQQQQTVKSCTSGFDAIWDCGPRLREPIVLVKWNTRCLRQAGPFACSEGRHSNVITS